MRASGPEHFYAMHRHGFVRVATSTPRVRTADVGFNRDAIIAEARARRRRAGRSRGLPRALRLVLRDRRPAPADGAPRRRRGGGRRIVAASAELLPGAAGRRAAAAARAALQLRAWRSRRGRLLGVVPKSYLPNYREYYEKRWFAHGRDVAGQTHRRRRRRRRRSGSDLIFEADDLPGFVFHVEICEDFWAAVPPSSAAALAGATILANLSASNIVIGKSDERHLLCRSQSARAIAAYVYSAAGPGREHDRPRLGRAGGDLRARRPAGGIRALPAGAASSASPTSTPAASSPSGCGRRPSPTRPRQALRSGRPFRQRRPSSTGRPFERHRADPAGPALPLRAEPADASRPGLLRGLQHPGRGPAPALRGDQRRAHGDRRLRRARFDPRADRRGQGLRPAGPAAHAPSSASPCRASPPARRPRATPGR